MRLTGLSIRNFRNLAAQDLHLPAEGLALIGANAQGKTNLLEAIYYLEVFRSFRGAPDDQLVAFGEDVFRLTAVLEDGADRSKQLELSAAFQREGRSKRVRVDGTEADRLGDAVGRVGVVLFSPADISLVSGPPGERRRFLDVVLSLNRAGYLTALQRFRQSLQQRNAALKEEQPARAVQAWDEPLVAEGSAVVAARRQWVRESAESFSAYHAEAAGGEVAEMRYEPSFLLRGAESEEDVRGVYREALLDSSARERRLGSTVVGPHRDDLSLQLPAQDGGQDVRRFGSGGQMRTVALALRLVEADTIKTARRRSPLVLLDDIFAELDAARGERVMRLLEMCECGQLVLTAPKESDVRVRKESLPRWHIARGRIAS